MKSRLLGLSLLLLLFVLLWRWGLGGSDAELAPIRIVCQGDQQRLRCPSECEVRADGQVVCRCEDEYRRSAQGGFEFSGTHCH